MPPDHPTESPPALTRSLPLAALWRVRHYLRPYAAQLVFMIAAACAAVAAQIAIPLVTKSIVDGAISHGRRDQLVGLALAATGLGAGQALLSFIRRWVQARAVTGMEQSMRQDLYAHLQELHPAFHDEWQSGQLLSRATTDLSAIRRFAGFGTVFLITNVLTFAAVIALLIRLDAGLGALTALALAPVLVTSAWFERRYRVLSRLAQDQQGDLATMIEEAATGIAVLKALGRRDVAIARHRAQAAAIYQTQVRKARLRGTFWAGLDLIPNAVIGLLLLLGALAVAHHQLSIGGLIAFVTLTLQLVWPIEAMGYILASGQEAATAAQRIYEIFDTAPEITSRPATAHQPQTAYQPQTVQEPGTARPPAPGRVRRPRPRGTGRRPARLVFDRVEYSHPGAAAPALRGVSLTVEPGQTLALTGAAGAGKTTLLQLVPRLADPAAGRVLLDGTDIRDLPLPGLRARVACAFEEPTLFSASVRENVTFGAPGATEEEIGRALRVAQAGFAYELPWGLDTRIGERGMALSGGQRQRIALARAILASPSVLVLDDPLSALDVHTEEKVTSALHDVLAGTTALVVAHRPSTVTLADTVALLAGGVVAAVGTHSQLLASEPRYRDLMGGEPAAPTAVPGPAAGLGGQAVAR